MRNFNIILNTSTLIFVTYAKKRHKIVAETLPSTIISPVNVTEIMKYLLTYGPSKNKINNLIDKSLKKIILFKAKYAFVPDSLYNYIK